MRISSIILLCMVFISCQLKNDNKKTFNLIYEKEIRIDDNYNIDTVSLNKILAKEKTPFRVNKNDEVIIKVSQVNDSLDLFVDKWLCFEDKEDKLIVLFSFFPNTLNGNYCLIEYEKKTGTIEKLILTGKPKTLVIKNYNMSSIYTVSSVLTTNENINIVDFQVLFTGELNKLEPMINTLEIK